MNRKPLYFLGLLVCLSLLVSITVGQNKGNNGKGDRLTRYCPLNPTETEKNAMEADFSFRRSALGKRPQPSPGGKVTIPVYVHVIVASNGSGGPTSQQMTQQI